MCGWQATVTFRLCFSGADGLPAAVSRIGDPDRRLSQARQSLPAAGRSGGGGRGPYEGARRGCITARPDLGSPRPPPGAAGKRLSLAWVGRVLCPLAVCCLRASAPCLLARVQMSKARGPPSTTPAAPICTYCPHLSPVRRGRGRAGRGGLQPWLTRRPTDPQPPGQVSSAQRAGRGGLRP